jgi:glucose/arabinose dehydrogenase
LIPTVNIAPAKAWSANGKPVAALALTVNAFAEGLDLARWRYVLPNGDVLVAETNAPPRPRDGLGIKGWMTRRVMDEADAGASSANRITLFRDADGDGVAENRSLFVEGPILPFGIVLVGTDFYAANADAVVSCAYTQGQIRIPQPGTAAWASLPCVL